MRLEPVRADPGRSNVIALDSDLDSDPDLIPSKPNGRSTGIHGCASHPKVGQIYV